MQQDMAQPGEYQETPISALDSFIKRYKFEELAQE